MKWNWPVVCVLQSQRVAWVENAPHLAAGAPQRRKEPQLGQKKPFVGWSPILDRIEPLLGQNKLHTGQKEPSLDRAPVIWEGAPAWVEKAPNGIEGAPHWIEGAPAW